MRNREDDFMEHDPGGPFVSSGEEPRLGNRADRWGNIVTLATVAFQPYETVRRTGPLVSIPQQIEARLFAVTWQFRPHFNVPPFHASHDWTPWLKGTGGNDPWPQDYQITFRVIRGIDPQGGTVEEVFRIGPNMRTLPSVWRAYSLNIAVMDISGGVIDIAAQASIVHNMGDGGAWQSQALAGYSRIGPDLDTFPETERAIPKRYAAPAAPVLLLTRNPNRRQFIVQNQCDVNLAVMFGSNTTAPSLAPGAELFTMLLPPGTIYESPIGGYCGDVQAIAEGAEPLGYVMVTEGYVP